MPGLALTFDDGPDPVWTAELLDVLASVRAKATFFPIAGRAKAHPELIERMLAEGHTIGLHCCANVRHTDRSESWLRRDTSTALAILSELGVDPIFWRTPWGITAPWTVTVAREHRLNLMGWTVDTNDWRDDSAEEMFEATRESLFAGSIVLAHDSLCPGDHRTDPEQTLRYVELVAAHARHRGLELDALGSGFPREPRREVTRLPLPDLDPSVEAVELRRDRAA